MSPSANSAFARFIQRTEKKDHQPQASKSLRSLRLFENKKLMVATIATAILFTSSIAFTCSTQNKPDPPHRHFIIQPIGVEV